MLRKSVVKEGGVKNRKKKSLMKNVHKLSKMLGGLNVSYDMFGKNSDGDTDYERKHESFRQKNVNSAVPFITLGIYCYIMSFSKNLVKRV